MDNKAKLLRRLLALCGVLILFCGIAASGLFSLQVVHGEEYRRTSQRKLTGSSAVSASRGEILDRYGRPLVTNKSVFSLRIDAAAWDKEQQNDVILRLAKLVRESGVAIEDSLPISQDEPFVYIGEPADKGRKTLTEYLSKLKLEKPLPKDPSAAQVMEVLRETFAIDSALSDIDARTVAGVRYEMKQANFSVFNSFIFAQNVDIDLIAKVKEQHQKYPGVEVEVSAVRSYATNYAAHILGRVGKIYAEEWDYYREKGYSMNAIVGKDGMEKALEDYLHGVNGTRAIQTDVTGQADEVEGIAPQPGNNCILTIDLDLQKATEDSLALRLSELPHAEGGAAVVVSVDTGEVLALASYPTYNLETFSKDYSALKKDESKPMFNRAIAGAYAPGSTYKVLTAVAALQEGVIDENFTQVCHKYYTRFASRAFSCLGYHGKLNVVSAIKKSCNVFFYEVGWRLGGAKLEEWANKFGFGQKTGIELAGEAAGTVAGPESRAAMLENNPNLNKWQPGDAVQAAIGQSDNAFTPLQLANYIATVVNGGKRYRLTLLKCVKNYDFSKVVKEESPVVEGNIEISPKTEQLVKTGMNEVVSEGGTAARIFANYPIKIGGKSGTAQLGKADKADNGVFVAFAPYDDPEIAICVVGEGAEHGSSVAPIVKDILDAYFAVNGNADVVTKENILLH